MHPSPTHSFKSIVDKTDGGFQSLHFIIIPHEIAAVLSDKFPFRVLCTMNGFTFHAGIVKRGLDGFVIQMGMKTVKSCNIALGQEVEVKIQADETEYGYELPEEMQELLLQDDIGRDNWEALNPGHKRSLLHYVCSTKNPELRIKRSLIILQRAAEIRAERKKKGLE